MQKTILELVSCVQESVDSADIEVMSALTNSYIKSYMIMRETETTVQEGFKDDLNAPILGNKDESIVKRILMMIPRLIAKIAEMLKRIVKAGKDMLKLRKRDSEILDADIAKNKTAIEEKFKADGIIRIPLHLRNDYPLNGYLSDLTNARGFIAEVSGKSIIPTYKQYDVPEVGAVKVWTPNQRGGVPVIRFLTKANDAIKLLVDKPVEFSSYADILKFREINKEYLDQIEDVILDITDIIDEYKKYFDKEIKNYIERLTGDYQAEYSNNVAIALTNIAKACSVIDAFDKELYRMERRDAKAFSQNLNNTSWLDYGKDNVSSMNKKVSHTAGIINGTDFDALGQTDVDLKLKNDQES